MKFGRSILLLLFFGLLLPTFINAKPKDCAVGGKCYWNGQPTSDVFFGMDSKTCDDGKCYVFKCMHSDGKIMYGSGCYEDFVNTCGFIQSSIMENAKKDNNFMHNDESVIVVSCGDDDDNFLSGCALHEFVTYAKDKNATFGLKHNKTDQMKGCDYDNKFIPPSQPQVQCAKGGFCVTGRTKSPPPIELSNVTCNACASFSCNVNGKFMVGFGCLNDFERICTNIPAAGMQKIKAGKKLYNYIDENNVVSSCGVGDYCSVGLIIEFEATIKDKVKTISAPVLANKGEICPYDPQPPKPSEPKDNGSNGYKLSGMFALGFALFYLW
uniref:Uncharacterized protein n=1 Tax=Panagrolaimus davidi TaxID=227884 RepID=A0A914QPU2_9BILA